jgi:DNA polymerase-3 subunit delta
MLEYAAEPEPDVVLVVTTMAAPGRHSRRACAPRPGDQRREDHQGPGTDGVRPRGDPGSGGKANEEAAEALGRRRNDLRELAAHALSSSPTPAVASTSRREPLLRGRAEASGFRRRGRRDGRQCGRRARALRWALHVGVDPVPIADASLTACARSRVASAGRGSSFQLASSLGMPPWKVERAQRVARGWSAEGLGQAMLAAADCNAAVKGGSDNRGYALEQAVLAVARARGTTS